MGNQVSADNRKATSPMQEDRAETVSPAEREAETTGHRLSELARSVPLEELDSLLEREESAAATLWARVPTEVAVPAGVLGWLLGAGLVYRRLNGWPYWQSYYYAVNVGYSIGFGDLADMNETSRFFSIVMICLGAGAVGGGLGFFVKLQLESSEDFAAKVRERQAAARRRQQRGHVVLGGVALARLGSGVLRGGAAEGGAAAEDVVAGACARARARPPSPFPSRRLAAATDRSRTRQRPHRARRRRVAATLAPSVGRARARHRRVGPRRVPAAPRALQLLLAALHLALHRRRLRRGQPALDARQVFLLRRLRALDRRPAGGQVDRDGRRHDPAGGTRRQRLRQRVHGRLLHDGRPDLRRLARPVCGVRRFSRRNRSRNSPS